MINIQTEKAPVTGQPPIILPNAMDLLINGEFVEAEETALATLAQDPTDSSNRRELCKILFAASKIESLRKYAQEGLTRSALNEKSFYLSFIAYCDGEYEDSLNHFVAHCNSNQEGASMLLIAAEIQQKIGMYTEAFYNYKKFVQQTSAAPIFVEKQLTCLEQIEATQFSEPLYEGVRDYIQHESMDPSRIHMLAASLIFFKYQINSQYPSIDINAAWHDKILISALDKITFQHRVTELAFGHLRKQLLKQCLDDGNLTPELVGLIAAMGSQSYNVEYIYSYDQVEKDTLEGVSNLLTSELASDNPDMLDVTTCTLLLAMYEDISKLPVAEQLTQIPQDAWPADTLSTINRILQDKILIDKMDAIPATKEPSSAWAQSIAQINDGLSKDYWRFLAKNVASDVSEGAFNIKRHLEKYFPQEAANILVAGASTGKHALELALRNPTATIYAIDISGKRLAYAKKMAQLNNIKNVVFHNLDIADCDVLEKEFHIVDARNVLNNVEEPSVVVKKLIPLLKPSGILQLNLNSALAREKIIQLKLANQKINFQLTLDNMRELRSAVLYGTAENLSSLASWDEFYRTSSFVNNFFNHYEHNFIIDDIKNLTQDSELEWVQLNFSKNEEGALNQYASQFPKDKHFTNLNNWQVFEEAHPGVFAQGYPLILLKK